MMESILNAVLGARTEKNGEKDEKGGIGSLLIIGAIVFVLLGGLKLLQPPEDRIS